MPVRPSTSPTKGALGPCPPGRSRRAGDSRAAREDQGRSRRDRGHHPRLRLSGRRAGAQRRTADWVACRSAAFGRRDDGQPLLRLVDERDPHRGRPDRDRRGRGVHLRRARIDEPDPDGRLQPDAERRAGRRAPAPTWAWARPPRTSRRNTRSLAPSRKQLAVKSQQKAAAARPPGKFADEIVPIQSKGGTVSEDGTIRGRAPRPRRWPGSSRRSTRTARSPRAPRRRSPTAPRRCWSPRPNSPPSMA